MSEWDDYEESPHFYVSDEIVDLFVKLLKQEIDEDILKKVEEEAMKDSDNVDFFCTKCQKVCTGIDCGCTHEKNIVEVHTLPDGSKAIYDEREALKDHPEIPTEEDIARFNDQSI